MMIDVLAGTMMTVGALLAVIAGLGLQRFPDVFARMHAATKPATLGMVLIVGGAALLVPDVGNTAKLLLAVVLQFITAPVGAHLVGRSAYQAGTELAEGTSIDELATAQSESADGT